MGAGRPRTLANAIKLAFWVECDLFEEAKKSATEKGTNVSEFLRAALSRLAGGWRLRPRRRKPVGAVLSSLG